jgi:hypothetical protein
MFSVLLVAPICFENALHLGASERRPFSSLSESIGVGFYAESREETKKHKVAPKGARPPSSRRGPSSPSPARASTAMPVGPEEMVDMVAKFQSLVRETHFWPCVEVDDASFLREFNDRGVKTRLDTLYGMAVEYIDRLHECCVRDSIGVVGRHFNKPNVHRLLELYAHTIPAFGHCKHVQELFLGSTSAIGASDRAL